MATCFQSDENESDQQQQLLLTSGQAAAFFPTHCQSHHHSVMLKKKAEKKASQACLFLPSVPIHLVHGPGLTHDSAPKVSCCSSFRLRSGLPQSLSESNVVASENLIPGVERFEASKTGGHKAHDEHAPKKEML